MMTLKPHQIPSTSVEGMYMFHVEKSPYPLLAYVTGRLILINEVSEIEDSQSLSFRFTEEDIKHNSTAKTLADFRLSNEDTEHLSQLSLFVTTNWDDILLCRYRPGEQRKPDTYMSSERLYEIIRALRAIYPYNYDRESIGLAFGDPLDARAGSVAFRVTSKANIFGVMALRMDEYFKTLKTLETVGQL